MTVCIATSNYLPGTGGIVRFTQNLASILTKAGHRVIILTVNYDSNEDQISDENPGCTVVELGESFHQKKKYYQSYFSPGSFDAPAWIAMGFAMRNWLLENAKVYKIDIIEASDYGGFAAFLCNSQLPPLVLTGHGSLLQYARYNLSAKDDHSNLISGLEKISMICASAIISHSELDKKDLELISGRPVSFARIPWEDSTLLNKNISATREMVVIGGLQPIKGIYVLAESMEKLAALQSDISVRWIGPDTYLAPGKQKMSAYLEKKFPKAWGNNLLWSGERSSADTQSILNNASVILVPSVFETFNYVALEAANAGKAIIISTGAGASGFFENGKNALVIPSADTEALVEAMRKISKDNSLKTEIGRKAKEMLVSTFSTEEILKDRISIYEKLVNQANKDADGEIKNLLRNYKRPHRKLLFKIRILGKKLLSNVVKQNAFT